MENDSNPQQKNSAQCRKSKRARKPNSFYVQGITQSKKVMSKPKKKAKAQEDYCSYTQERDERDAYQSRPYDYDNSEEWLSCHMPDHKKIKVGVYIKGTQKQVEKKKKQQRIMDVKPKGQTDLLSLFKKAIQDVAIQEAPKPKSKQPSAIFEEHHFDFQKIGSQTYRVPPPKKIPKEDKQGRIERAAIGQGTLTFFHTKLGQINFDTTWHCPKESIQNQEQTRYVNQLKEKISKRKILPTVLARHE